MDGSTDVDVLVVGGGPAGIQGTRTLKTLAPDLRVTVLRPEPFSVIYCAIPYAIEGLIDPKTIAKKDALITDVGAELRKVEATKADLSAKTVETADGEVFHYEKLLIVTGARPFVPPLPGHQLGNILTVKTASDAERIMESAKKAKRAVVIGSGAIGIEQAQALTERGIEVDLVEMAPHPLPAMLDEEFGGDIAKKLESAGVHFRGGRKLTAFEGDEHVSGVVLDDGTTIPLEEGRDFVIVSVGLRPDLGPFEESDLERERDGLIVDDHMRTSIPDVYAAGDCVHFWSGIDGKPIGGKLATNAVPMAKVAAKNIAGVDASYPGFFNGAATCVRELRVGSTGFTEAVARARGFRTVAGWGETTSKFPMMPGARPVRVKIIADAETGRVIGGQVLGEEAVAERVDVITLAIQAQMSLQQLAALSYSAQPWQTFFPARNAIVQAAEDALKNLAK